MNVLGKEISLETEKLFTMVQTFSTIWAIFVGFLVYLIFYDTTLLTIRSRTIARRVPQRIK